MNTGRQHRFVVFALGFLLLGTAGAATAKNLQIDLTNKVGVTLEWAGGKAKYGNISEYSEVITSNATGSVRGTHKYQADKAASIGAGGFLYKDQSASGLQITYQYQYDSIKYCHDVKVKVVKPDDGSGITWRYKIEKAKGSSNSGCHRYYNIVPCGANECQ